MRYRNELEKLLKEEKNIVNRMYLNEIAIQLKKLESALTDSPDSEDYFDHLASMLNNFTKQFENPKYQYNRTTKNGFKRDSVILSSLYLDDLIELLISDQAILNNKGIKWEHQPFSMNLFFTPHYKEGSKQDLTFESKPSTPLLQLTQKIDLQYRVYGKRVFQRAEVVLPLLIFQTYKNFTEEDFIRIDYYSAKAKQSLRRSKTIIVCETVNKNVVPEINGSHIDSLIILRRQVSSSKLEPIKSEMLVQLRDQVNNYLYQDECEVDKIIERGCIS
ncbi:MAG: hypothetical protein WCX83_03840 [Candidatus Cloacimonas sp.]